MDCDSDKLYIKLNKFLNNGNNISNISRLDTYVQQNYEVEGAEMPDMVFMEMGTNDMDSYMGRPPHNTTLQDILRSQELAHTLLGLVDRVKAAGAGAVMVGAALPRLAGGKYGAARYLGEDATDDDWERAEDRGVMMTRIFNAALRVGCDTRGERIAFCKKMGLADGWEMFIGDDGCHLASGIANYKLLKSIRGPIIHFSKKQ